MARITVKNTKLNYFVKGKGNPIIFLHGALIGVRSYQKLIDELSKSYKVYAVDMPMHGRSGNLKDPSLDDFSDIVASFIKIRKVKNPIVVAHSAGAIVAMRLCSKINVRKLILLEPAGFSTGYNTFTLFLKLILETIKDFFHDPIITSVMCFESIQTISKNLFNKKFWRIYQQGMSSDFTQDLKMIGCDTVIAGSKKDKMIPWKDFVKMNEIIKTSRLIEIDSLHDWPIIYPKKVRGML